jgi:hypothetical protein
MRTRTLAILPLLVPFAFAYACGGDEKPNPATPPPSGSDTATTTSATAMMSAAPSAASAAPTNTEPPKPVEPPYVLGIAAGKFTPDKAAKIKAIEIKDDGTVLLAGKATYKVAKDELQDTSGKTLLKVAKDGTVTQGDGKPYGKFDDKDQLNVDGGDTIAIGDDGALKVTSGGKAVKEAAGKFDKLDAKGRRAAALVFGVERMLTAITQAPKKDEPKKDEPTKDAPKKDAPKKDAPKK